MQTQLRSEEGAVRDLHLLRMRTSIRVRLAFGRRNGPLPVSPKNLIGCTYEELYAHLGALGDDNDIDHIVPIHFYDMSNPIDWYRAFNYRNTRLLRHGAHKKRAKCGLPDKDTLWDLRDIWPAAWGDAIAALCKLTQSP